MPPSKGTLYEYDMILATTQHAINAQFVNLYNTPDPEDFTKTLIPNCMTLGFTRYNEEAKEWEDTDEGLQADEVECPVVDINSINTGDQQHRAVQMRVKISEGNMTYLDANSEAQTVVVDGWTFSWIAAIGTSVIKDVDRESMHPKAKEALKKALSRVPNQNFLPSKIFCSFESSTIGKTFKLYNKDGEDVSHSDAAKRFLSYFTTTYTKTDHLPWILGYNVTQTIPHPSTELPKFWPVQSWFSTTPYTGQGDRATLNFCLITSGPHDPALVDPARNPKAGVLSAPFVDTTRATDLPSDGILAISSQVFYEQWLGPTILNQIHAKPSYYTGGGKVTLLEQSGGMGSLAAFKKEEFDTEWVDYDQGDWDYGIYVHRQTITISAHLNISSILQEKPSGTIPIDTRRNLTVIVKGTKTIVNMRKKKGVSDSDPSYTKSEYPGDFKFGFTIGAGDTGSWAVAWIPGSKIDIGHSSLQERSEPKSTVVDQALAQSKDDGYEKSGASDIAANFAGIYPGFLFSTAAVMPCGDVFTFQGLDCDNNGNLYTHIKYRTIDS